MIVRWSLEKALWLKQHRGVDFDAVKAAIDVGLVLDDREHPTRKGQRMFVLSLDGYVCAVPYVRDGEAVFLKTAYRSRKLNSAYGVKDGKTQSQTKGGT